MIILSLNSGSSSLKFQLYDYEKHETMSTGIVERVTIGGSFIKYSNYGGESIKQEHECPDHKEAIKLILNTITNEKTGVLKDLSSIAAVGHRVVHGGEKFRKSVIITKETIEILKDLFDLAPLHNPANVLGIEAAMEVMPGIPHMAVLDTAWHQTMHPEVFMYALPRNWYTKHNIRRYGFHGTSLLYCAKRAAVLLGKDPFQTNVVILHIGNGVSANAVKNGLSFDTSMGLTPLEGLVMGTRSGDADLAIPLHMMQAEGKTAKEMSNILNKQSGILGITDGQWADRRDVEIAAGEGNELAKLAIEMESYRLKKYIGAYAAAIGGIDAIVFTAGVGEMSATIRAKAVEGLEFMGIKIDHEKNKVSRTRNAELDISAPDSAIKVFIIPTDEERVIIEDVVALLNGTYDEHMRFEYPFQKADYQNRQRVEEFERECQKKPYMRDIEAKIPKK